MAAPVIQSMATTEPGNFVTSFVINKPTGTVEGDLLVAIVTGRNGSAGGPTGVTLPSGWTLIRFAAQPGNGEANGFCAYKVAGASEPTSYTFTWQAQASRATGGIYRITGYDPAAPIADSSVNHAVSSGPVVGTSVTGAEDSLLLFSGGANRSATPEPTVDLPSGMTSQWYLLNWSGSLGNRHRGASQSVGAGATGDRSAAINGVNWIAFMVVIASPIPWEYWNATTQAWQSTQVWNTGSADQHTFPADTWPVGSWLWTAATKDAMGAEGPFAADRTVEVSAGTGRRRAVGGIRIGR